MNERAGSRAAATAGRGAASNPAARYRTTTVEAADDWPTPAPGTDVTVERVRSIIARNRSPDVPFDRSINPYRGCEHGCIYCFARPTHAYLDLSPGLDFETRLTAKIDAAERLRETFAAPSYRPGVIALGANTDPYQPIEREHAITRRLLEVLLEHRQPVSITTKGALIERDLDLLESLAAERLVSVQISLTTLDAELKRALEPRAAGPRRRLSVIARLAARGVPVGVLIAPLIPALTDHELETLLAAAADAGAGYAAYLWLRLPLEVAPLFEEWLARHRPDRAARVLGAVRSLRGGRLNDPRFGARHRGEGPLAALAARRFELARRRAELAARGPTLDVSRFRRPNAQLALL